MPPSASSNLPRRRGHRAGEGAALVAEELGLDQLLGDGRAVDLDEGPSRRAEQGVDGAGHQLLAGAVLAVDEHAAVARARRCAICWRRAVASAALSPTISWPRSSWAAQRAVLALEPARARGRGSTVSSVFSSESGFSMKS